MRLRQGGSSDWPYPGRGVLIHSMDHRSVAPAVAKKKGKSLSAAGGALLGLRLGPSGGPGDCLLGS